MSSRKTVGVAPRYKGKTAAEMSMGPALPPLETGEHSELVMMDESDGPKALKDSVALEAFMQEKVVVMLVPSSDANAPSVVPFGVNGRTVWVQPGVETLVARCYVERMARAKTTAIKQDLSPGQGEKLNTLYRRKGVDYNFQVIKDSQRGRDWLNKIMQEP